MRKVTPMLAAAVASAGLGLTALAGTATASTGPRAFTQDSAGFSVTHAQFRFVQDSVFLRAPSKFAAIDDGVSWETHLAGIRTTSNQPVEVSVNIGGDPQTESSYHAWATIDGQPMATQGDINFSAGQSVTESIYYSKANGVVSVSAFDVNGDSFFGQAFVGSNVSFGKASIYGGFDQGSSFAAPSAPVTLGHFTGAQVTTYSGHHGTIAGWYSHNKVLATSDGTPTGVVRVAPSGLTGGRSFSVFFEPAS
jgi:hypothetical protein